MTPSELADRLDELSDEANGYGWVDTGGKLTQAAATIREQAETIRKHESIAIHPDVEHYPLKAFIWKRDSTEEWVLQIEGTINDTCFVIRHPQPFSLSPEDAVGLPALYAQAEALKIATEALEPLANMAAVIGNGGDDSVYVGQSGHRLTYGDFRRAAQALARIKGN